jgi:hypothetical protein
VKTGEGRDAPTAESGARVGVLIVTSGCSGGDSHRAAVNKAKSLMEKIGDELGIAVQIKEVGGAQAMRGGIPASLMAETRRTYALLGERVIPSIAINGKWVSIGDPDEAALKKAMLDACSRYSTSRGENRNE